MGMTLFELLKDQKVDQIGFLYKNAEKQAKKMEETFGMPPFAFIPNAKSQFTYRGKASEIELRLE
jgi:hypothetical protein